MKTTKKHHKAKRLEWFRGGESTSHSAVSEPLKSTTRQQPNQRAKSPLGCASIIKMYNHKKELVCTPQQK